MIRTLRSRRFCPILWPDLATDFLPNWQSDQIKILFLIFCQIWPLWPCSSESCRRLVRRSGLLSWSRSRQPLRMKPLKHWRFKTFYHWRSLYTTEGQNVSNSITEGPFTCGKILTWWVAKILVLLPRIPVLELRTFSMRWAPTWESTAERGSSRR